MTEKNTEQSEQPEHKRQPLGISLAYLIMSELADREDVTVKIALQEIIRAVTAVHATITDAESPLNPVDMTNELNRYAVGMVIDELVRSAEIQSDKGDE